MDAAADAPWWLAGFCLEIASSEGISTLPLKMAPSATMTLGVRIFPSRKPLAIISIFCRAVRLPLTFPLIWMIVPKSSASTWPVRPTVIRAAHVSRPENFPSMMTSSSEVISPLMSNDCPRIVQGVRSCEGGSPSCPEPDAEEGPAGGVFSVFVSPKSPNLALSWSGQRGSNPRHQAWEACTLPTELCPPSNIDHHHRSKEQQEESNHPDPRVRVAACSNPYQETRALSRSVPISIWRASHTMGRSASDAKPSKINKRITNKFRDDDFRKYFDFCYFLCHLKRSCRLCRGHGVDSNDLDTVC